MALHPLNNESDETYEIELEGANKISLFLKNKICELSHVLQRN